MASVSAPGVSAGFSARAHHCFVYDAEQVVRFFELLLKPHLGGQWLDAIVLQPIARHKYRPDVVLHPKNVGLARTIVTSTDAGNFVRKVLAYEVPLECFVVSGADGKEMCVPTNAIVLYATLSPKSPCAALGKLNQEFLALLGSRMKESAESKGQGPESKGPRESSDIAHALQDALHRSPSCFPFFDLDIDVRDVDSPDIDPLVWVPPFAAFMDLHRVWPAVACVLRTRGGYHVILDRAQLAGDTMEALHRFEKGCNVRLRRTGLVHRWLTGAKSPQVPIAGTIQGGYPVTMLDRTAFRAEIGYVERSTPSPSPSEPFASTAGTVAVASTAATGSPSESLVTLPALALAHPLAPVPCARLSRPTNESANC
jgi:hypothetical protein